MHLIVLLGAWIKQKLISICLDIVLISTQERCTVCTEGTTFMEIFSGTPMVLQGDIAQVEAYFGLFGDSVNPEAR
jgi:hypothetical protein